MSMFSDRFMFKAAAAAGVAFAAAAFSVPALWGQRATNDWRDYLGGPDSAHYTPLKQIDAENAVSSQVAWTYETQDNSAYAFAPLVVDNVAYVLAKGGSSWPWTPRPARRFGPSFAEALAAGPRQGLRRRRRRAAAGGAAGRGGRGGIGLYRGLNYWESKDRSDRRIILPVSNQLQELDARTGKPIESFGDHGLRGFARGRGARSADRPARSNRERRGASSRISSFWARSRAKATCRLRDSCAPTTS